MSDTATTRTRSFPVPASIRIVFGILSKLAPGLAWRLARYLFFRPVAFPVPKRELTFRENHSAGFLSFHGQELPVFRTGNGDRKILLVHGWSGRGSQFFKLCETLAERGFSCWTFDAPGHVPGKTGSSHMLQFVEAIREMEQRFGPFEAAVGHSLGGMALFNALRYGFSTGKLVTMGTPSSVIRVIDDFCLAVNASPSIATKLRKHLEERFEQPADYFSADYIASTSALPGLIVQDENDQDVEMINALDLHKAWKTSELMITKGLGHRKILHAELTVKAVADYLEA